MGFESKILNFLSHLPNRAPKAFGAAASSSRSFLLKKVCKMHTFTRDKIGRSRPPAPHPFPHLFRTYLYACFSSSEVGRATARYRR